MSDVFLTRYIENFSILLSIPFTHLEGKSRLPDTWFSGEEDETPGGETTTEDPIEFTTRTHIRLQWSCCDRSVESVDRSDLSSDGFSFLRRSFFLFFESIPFSTPRAFADPFWTLCVTVRTLIHKRKIKLIRSSISSPDHMYIPERGKSERIDLDPSYSYDHIER